MIIYYMCGLAFDADRERDMVGLRNGWNNFNYLLFVIPPMEEMWYDMAGE